MENDVVVGLDAGGSFTRAVCASVTGEILGRGGRAGGSPEHNSDAREHISGAILDALEAAHAAPSTVRALVAGIAGLNDPSDLEWAEEFTAGLGIAGTRVHVNDAEVAHAGAFGGAPGIMAISGTGYIALGITDSGRRVWGDDFQHYAGGARHLGYDLSQRILIGEGTAEDAVLVEVVLDYWGASDLHALREILAIQGRDESNAVKRRYGGLAPIVTEHAASSRLAASVLDRLVEATRVGIELVATTFSTRRVPVALEGGVATSEPFTRRLRESLETRGSRCELVEPLVPPTEGAVLLAIRELGALDESIVDRLVAQVRTEANAS